MIRVAYYFGRYDARRGEFDSAVPLELAHLGVTSRTQSIELFRAAVGDGRNEATFRGSLSGDIRYISTTLRAGNPLGESRRGPVGDLLFASDSEVWEAVRGYIDFELLPGAR